MNKKFAPLLAVAVELNDVVFPVYASSKLDGIRCLIRDGRPVSRKLLPIPNDMITAALSGHPALEGLDGELICGSETDELCFNTTGRLVGKKDAVSNDWHYNVFDCSTDPETPFKTRTKSAEFRVELAHLPYVRYLPQTLVHDKTELSKIEKKNVEDGYEGTMVRSPDGPYKFGRSTAKEGILLKRKMFKDTEVRILSVYEGKTNNNKATKDALGHAKRSTSKAGKIANGTLGGFEVEEVETGIQFKVGGGWTDAQAADLWANRNDLPGTIHVVRYQVVGTLNKPRFPEWKGPRLDVDMP